VSGPLVEVCQGLACREAGSDELWSILAKGSGLTPAFGAAEGLCRQFCFGRCAIGPNVRINGQFHHNQFPSEAVALLETIKNLSK
jgi:NADH:ubiquinone oxidoreductase subunit E